MAIQPPRHNVTKNFLKWNRHFDNMKIIFFSSLWLTALVAEFIFFYLSGFFTKKYISPLCLRLPAANSAYGSLPQKMSARPVPFITPPVS